MCRLHGCRCGGRARGALRARGAFSPPPLHLLLILLLAPSALGTLSEQDEQTCLMALIGSGFDHHAFDRYGEWYDEKSTARFAQTELFEGVKEIEEYVGITSERSPYLELGEIIDVTATVVERSDDGECVVLYATLHGELPFSDQDVRTGRHARSKEPKVVGKRGVSSRRRPKNITSKNGALSTFPPRAGARSIAG